MEIKKFCILIFILTLTLFVGFVKSGACPEANFPIIVGGSLDDSKIYALDYLETASIKRFAMGGYTRDKDVKGPNKAVAGTLPLILSYTPDNNGKIGQPDWGYTVALLDYSFMQV